MKATDLFLNKALQYLESAEAFASKEIPIYVEELLKYEVFYHEMWLYWGFIPFLFLLFLTGIFSCTKSTNNDETLFAPLIGTTIFFMLAIATVPHSYMQLKKIEMAPRVYLLQNLRR